jgi:hypothetical protein
MILAEPYIKFCTHPASKRHTGTNSQPVSVLFEAIQIEAQRAIVEQAEQTLGIPLRSYLSYDVHVGVAKCYYFCYEIACGRLEHAAHPYGRHYKTMLAYLYVGLEGITLYPGWNEESKFFPLADPDCLQRAAAFIIAMHQDWQVRYGD